MYELTIEELENINGGSVWKYIGAVGTIGFGLYEISTGIGAVDGWRRVVGGSATVVGGLIVLFN